MAEERWGHFLRQNLDETALCGLIVGCVGYSLFLCWIWVVYYSNFAISWAGQGVDNATQLRVIMLVTLGCVLLLLGVSERVFSTPSGAVVSVVLALCLCPLPSITSLVFSNAGELVHGVAWALAGCGYAFLMVHWTWFLVVLANLRQRALIIASTMVLSAGVFFAATLLLPSVSIIVHALLPLASVVCSIFSHRCLVKDSSSCLIEGKDAVSPNDMMVLKVSKKALTMTWFSGAALGFCGYATTSNYTVGHVDMVLSALLLAAGILALLVVRHNKGSYPTNRLLWLYVPIAVFCLVPLCVMGEAGRMICSCILIAAFTVYDFADLDMLVMDMPHVAPHIIKVMTRGRLGNVMGLAIGWSMAACTSIWSINVPRAFEYACLGLVLVLVAASTYMFRDAVDHGAPTIVERSDTDLYDEQCTIFAKRYDLTKRQIEVLRLLGRGRTASVIQEKLFISESTAKSHIYNIYQKVGIHTQQELMELLDGEEANDHNET